MFQDNEVGGRLFGVYEGKVTDSADPKKLGRVKVELPGIADDPSTGWALPRGGRGRNRGWYAPPEVGAPVYVQFVNGDPDRPIYEPANFPEDEEGSFTPTDAQGVPPEDAAKIKTFETDYFSITIDEREAQPLLVIKNKQSGDMIEFDAKRQGITIQTAYMLRLISDAMVDIDAPTVKIKGRIVTATSKPL